MGSKLDSPGIHFCTHGSQVFNCPPLRDEAIKMTIIQAIAGKTRNHPVFAVLLEVGFRNMIGSFYSRGCAA